MVLPLHRHSFITLVIPDQLDQRKIKAINWLVYEEAQRMEAIKQANTLICQFLSKPVTNLLLLLFLTVYVYI